MSMIDWIMEQQSKINHLVGKTIVKSYGKLEPLDWLDDEDETPILNHPKLRFQQFTWLTLEFDDSTSLSFNTYENNAECGISLSPGKECDEKDFRFLEVSRSFIGKIEKIAVSTIGENISELKFSIGNKRPILVAGEVHPWDSGIKITLADESILMFDSPEAKEKTKFGEVLDIDLKSQCQNSE